MVRMIIVGPMREDNISLPMPDLANGFLARLEAWYQLPIVVAEHLRRIDP